MIYHTGRTGQIQRMATTQFNDNVMFVTFHVYKIIVTADLEVTGAILSN